MASRPLGGLLLCVLATTLLTPSLGEVVAPRKSFETLSKNIVYGEKAEAGRYPYVCDIDSIVTSCTGFLVHPKIIVTAAQCVAPSKVYFVTCGGVKRQRYDTRGTYAGKFVPDPSYIDLPGYHDVAIIVIAEEYNYLALPIVSRDNDEFKHGRPATAIGWGEIKEGTGLTPKKLKIARDIIPTDLLCGYKPQTLCGTSISGRAARGDSGGPLVIEGDSAKTDVVFGIFSTMATENGLHTMTFTNIPYYLDKFISPYARAIEKEMVMKRFPPCRRSKQEAFSSGGVRATANHCNVNFVATNSAKNGKASVKWGEVARNGAKVAFEIAIEDFKSDGLTDPGFILVIFEDISFYVHGDGETVAWIKDGEPLALSSIVPSSGVHNVRIENTETGYEIYEDGLKSAAVDIPFPRDTVVARFDSFVESAGLSYRISITSIRMVPDPAVPEELDWDTLPLGPEEEVGPVPFYL